MNAHELVNGDILKVNGEASKVVSIHESRNVITVEFALDGELLQLALRSINEDHLYR